MGEVDLDLEEADDELDEDDEEELDLLSGDLDLSFLSISESKFKNLSNSFMLNKLYCFKN